MERPNKRQKRRAAGRNNDNDDCYWLTSSKEIVLHVLGRRKRVSRSLWERLGRTLRKDRDIKSAAQSALEDLDLDLLKVGDGSDLLSTGKEILRHVFSVAPHNLCERIWKKLNPILRADWDLALYAIRKVLVEEYDDLDASLVKEKEFLLQAVERCPGIFRTFPANLLNDSDFVQVCLDKRPRILWFVPRQLQLAFPDMISACFSTLFFHGGYYYGNSKQLLRAIAPELWQNENFRSAWFQAGGYFDTELFLPLIPNCKALFALISVERDEMVDNVRSNSSIYAKTRFVISIEEQDLTADNVTSALLAFGGCINSRYIALRIRSRARPRRYYHLLYKYFCRRLEENDTFMKLILCAISKCNASPLALLNQGPDTSVVYKRLIAEYAGIATGEKMDKHRRAKANLGLSFE